MSESELKEKLEILNPRNSDKINIQSKIKLFYGTVLSRSEAKTYIKKIHPDIYKKLNLHYDGDWFEFVLAECSKLDVDGKLEFFLNKQNDKIFYYVVYGQILDLESYNMSAEFNGIANIDFSRDRYSTLSRDLGYRRFNLCTMIVSNEKID